MLVIKVRFNILKYSEGSSFRSDQSVEYIIHDLLDISMLFERLETILHNDFFRLTDVVTDVEIEMYEGDDISYGRYVVFRDLVTREYEVGESFYVNVKELV